MLINELNLAVNESITVLTDANALEQWTAGLAVGSADPNIVNSMDKLYDREGKMFSGTLCRGMRLYDDSAPILWAEAGSIISLDHVTSFSKDMNVAEEVISELEGSGDIEVMQVAHGTMKVLDVYEQMRKHFTPQDFGRSHTFHFEYQKEMLVKGKFRVTRHEVDGNRHHIVMVPN